MASVNLIGGGEIRDYAHASKVFRPNGFSRAGKFKFLFHVFFNINSTIDFPSTMKRDLSFFVKKVELPKFTIENRVLNQYNRKQVQQVKVNYQPITITFQDDNGNQIRELWRTYYNYYYADGRYPTETYLPNDKYLDRRNANVWGFNPKGPENFFDDISIYSLHGGKSFKIQLINPVITNFTHDTHDYASNSDLMEHTMQITYTGVKYLEGFWAGTDGFADPSTYDTTPSSQTPNDAGKVYDTVTGQTVTPTQTMTDNSTSNATANAAKQAQLASVANTNKGTVASITPTDTTNILSTQNSTAGPYVFPSASFNSGGNYSSLSPGAVSVGQNVQAISENTVLTNQNQYLGVFPTNTWQSALEQKGYSAAAITATNDVIVAALAAGVILNTAQAIAYAEKYIANSQSISGRQTPIYTTPASNYSVNFANTTSIQPVYNAQSWQQTLLAKGYQDYEISAVDNSLSNVNLSPEVDLVSYAERYILRNRVLS